MMRGAYACGCSAELQVSSRDFNPLLCSLWRTTIRCMCCTPFHSVRKYGKL